MPRDRVQDLQCVVEPPRDGEFFLDDASCGDEDRAMRFGEEFAGFVSRFPLRALSAAVIFGAVVSGAVSQLL